MIHDIPQKPTFPPECYSTSQSSKEEDFFPKCKEKLGTYVRAMEYFIQCDATFRFKDPVSQKIKDQTGTCSQMLDLLSNVPGSWSVEKYHIGTRDVQSNGTSTLSFQREYHEPGKKIEALRKDIGAIFNMITSMTTDISH